mgnify:CR=1 FL=1
MAEIVPAILANNVAEYARQMEAVAKFASRIQIDLMDGVFAKSISVGVDDVWWPHSIRADIHLMYQDPFDYLEQLIRLQPSLVIIHVETMIHHMHFAACLHKEGIKAGLAVLPQTPIANVEQILHSFDHLLIFSGNLGHFGGQADLSLLDKAREARLHYPGLEISWDGGVNFDNAKQIADGGIDVLAAGGAIQKSENPAQAYLELQSQMV